MRSIFCNYITKHPKQYKYSRERDIIAIAAGCHYEYMTNSLYLKCRQTHLEYKVYLL